MISEKNENVKATLLQFSPYICFGITYSLLYFYSLSTKSTFHSTATILAGLPLCTAFIATMLTLLINYSTLSINKKTSLFLSGIADVEVIESTLTIICIAIFNSIVAKTNGTLTAVTLGLLYLPTTWMLPILFLIASLCSIIIPLQYVSALILMPIAHGVAQSLHMNPAYTAATIISGTLCGRHIALSAQNLYLTIKNILTNNWIITTAGLVNLWILLHYQSPQLHATVYMYLQQSITMHSIITIIPYCILLVLQFLQYNLIASLTLSFCLGLLIQIFLNNYMLIDAITTMFTGFYSNSTFVNLALLNFMLAGLQGIVNHSDKLENQISKFISNKNKNNITILKSTIQSMLPYAATMFITIHITQCSYIEIMHYMIYPIFITTLSIISICISYLI